ncbi:OmpA family protein [Flavobacterium sp. NST-5]|uniref:OmpA family protein n=1 Tax=Flavobacterium ichthyis TaxID=2698827 RepID=A0ABW9ZC04_9FLAO|nr:OmpA family protein [Flavobacterium ichthyis]NBL66119.1 OmpA family protein [Flavobacterium ichthyis]
MKIHHYLAAFLFTTSLFAQKAQVKSADKQYEKYAYIDAIKTYERVAEKGYKSAEMFQKLGNAYYFNAQLPEANRWYAELFAMGNPAEAEYFYRYSQTLKSVGDYGKANEMLEQFNKLNTQDQRAKLYASDKDYLQKIKDNSGRYKVENFGINSEYSDYGTTVFGDKILFASARDTGGISTRKHRWTNQSFTQIYAAKLNVDGSIAEKPEKFSSSLNSKFHESTPVFSPDGQTIYFTRNNYKDGKKGKNSEKITLLKIYKATLEDGKWKNITELPFNSDDYSVAHPALSPDGKTLYFASDMPGTLGASDLWKVQISDDGSFGTPENLGKGINTEGRETFPFVSNENELYFASDGHPGLGGLDVFVTKILQNNIPDTQNVQNVGTPVNGPMDDFGYYINTETRFGYFSSNRSEGKGYDDIYRFQETKKLECEQLLAGTIMDLETKEIIADAKVTLSDNSFKVIKTTISDSEGNYRFEEVECGKNYYVKAEKPEYNTSENRITIGEKSGETTLDIELEKSVKPVTVGSDLAKTFGIEIIYFDLDKWNIRPDAAVDLAKIVDVMKQYPNMKVDVRSHTDSRQTHQYNEKLSDRRAKSTVAWMVSQGIEASRLTGKGYGETQLVNNCADGVNCSEADHQKNRRSEFVIVAM